MFCSTFVISLYLVLNGSFVLSSYWFKKVLPGKYNVKAVTDQYKFEKVSSTFKAFPNKF